MPEEEAPGASNPQSNPSEPAKTSEPGSPNAQTTNLTPASALVVTHNRILSTISVASALLLRSTNIEENMIDFLASLGAAIDIPICFLFTLNLDENLPRFQINYTWQRPGSPNLDIPAMLEPQFIRIRQSTHGLFLEAANPGTASSTLSDFSVAILPVNQADLLHGYLGLIGSPKDPAWTPTLRDALRISANLIGAILERKRFEDKFRENEIRNRLIIDALPDLVIRIDSSGKILDYTARKDHPLFINRDSITGKLLSEIWPKNIVRKILHGRKKGRSLTQYFLEEFSLPFSDKVYESRLDPISSQEALIVIRDVTEQAELRQMKSDFINQASHELRTPVTSAILMAELIQEGGQPKEIEEYWQILNSELNRQKILIDRLLIAGRLESGMMRLELAPTDLAAILQESISAVKPIARKKNISIKVSIPELTPKILGDKSGLQQVFINLINNAIKFSPDGSSVEIFVNRAGNNVEVAVTDQGMGIPANQTSHLFERFFRARDVIIAEIPGSGVGLYIVKSILEGLGGSIKLTNSSSAGTTFTASLRSAD